MIRNATAADAHAIASIHNYYVTNTTVICGEAAVTPEEMARRIDNVASSGLP
jgi:L-amino acid N-acyltransferase YncA